MELELLRTSWEKLDRKLQNTALFNEKLLENIISSRVGTTVDKIKRLYLGFYFVLTLEIIFLIALFIGNPFDFKYRLQFLPYVFLMIGVIVALINLISIDRAIRNLSPGGRIDQYLKNIVSIYEKNQRFEKWFGIIFLSVGLLVPLSFLPQKIERYGLTRGLLDQLIALAVVLGCYVIALKLGAFKNPYKDKLQRDLAEWNELKSLASRMTTE
jgi:hypothetical protein